MVKCTPSKRAASITASRADEGIFPPVPPAERGRVHRKIAERCRDIPTRAKAAANRLALPNRAITRAAWRESWGALALFIFDTVAKSATFVK